jgi:hypothetical protein
MLNVQYIIWTNNVNLYTCLHRYLNSQHVCVDTLLQNNVTEEKISSLDGMVVQRERESLCVCVLQIYLFKECK